MFINIHTHVSRETELEIVNLFPEDAVEMNPETYYSIGIHPWNVTKIDVKKQVDLLRKIASRENVFAVGEIGWDKLNPDFELQKQVFEKQAEIAVTLRKPMIIHCVKAYSELLEFLNKGTLKVPVIIHRYSGNIEIAGQLIRLGAYLSFGHELFHTGSKTPDVFKSIPLDRLFLETDDSDKTILEIYLKASELSGLTVDEIDRGISVNFLKCINTCF
jgi:TatD DNase family protein